MFRVPVRPRLRRLKNEQGSIDRALVIGADAMSRLTNPEDAGTAVLFADGAGAAIVQAPPR